MEKVRPLAKIIRGIHVLGLDGKAHSGETRKGR